jgi:hypothetical protein
MYFILDVMTPVYTCVFANLSLVYFQDMSLDAYFVSQVKEIFLLMA